MESLHSPKLSQYAYLPVECNELINPWFSTEYEDVFGAQEGETAREAALNQYNLLVKAGNDDKKMQSLIEGFGDVSYMMEADFKMARFPMTANSGIVFLFESPSMRLLKQ